MKVKCPITVAGHIVVTEVEIDVPVETLIAELASKKPCAICNNIADVEVCNWCAFKSNHSNFEEIPK